MGESGVFVHERGFCESHNVGEGTRIWAFAHVMAGARIGKNCNIGETAFVENEVVIGDGCTLKNGVCVWDKVTLEDGVFVGPHAAFTNDLRPRAFGEGKRQYWQSTLVKRGATIGANASIVCGITLGEFCLIGAGSVIHRDVPAHALMVGNPARQIGWVCYCGQTLKEQYCPACEKPFSEVSSPL